MPQPSSLALIANLTRRSTAVDEAEKLVGDPASREWITALHASACRRWLSCDPPRIEEADATLHLLHEIASTIGAIPAYIETGGTVDECSLRSVPPELTIPMMWRLLERLESALANTLE
jgi:hypothetical protein